MHFLRNAQTYGKRVLVASVRCAVTCHVETSIALPMNGSVSGEQTLWASSSTIVGTSLVGVKGHVPVADSS